MTEPGIKADDGADERPRASSAASSPSKPNGAPAPVTLGQAASRLGLLALAAGFLVLGAAALKPDATPNTDNLWGALLGDAWVIGGLRFIGAVAASFLLASILVLTLRGRWIERAAGVDAAPQVDQTWNREREYRERLRRVQETNDELLQLLDDHTAPDEAAPLPPTTP